MSSEAPQKTVQDPVIKLPTGVMFTLFGVIVLAIAACWLLLALTGAQPWSVAGAGLLGSLASVVVGGGGILILKPWQPRRAGDLALFWLGSTVLRVLVTPILALVLYFAAYPPIYPFVLGAGTAYLAILLSETALVALHMRGQFDSVQDSIKPE